MAKQLERYIVPREVWQALPEEDRYSVLVLGHIFNEAMMLQRMIFVSAPSLGSTQIERDANGAQMLFLAKTLCGKIFEARLIINSYAVSSFLARACFPLMEKGQGEQLRKEFNRAVSNSVWLKRARDAHAMHYPTFEEWKEVLPVMDAHKMGYEFVMGAYTGDTFYSTSESAANLSFYMEADDDWKAGLEVVNTETKKLSGSLGELIRSCLNAYFTAHWERPSTSNGKLRRKIAPKFHREPLDTFKLPYFFTLVNDNS